MLVRTQWSSWIQSGLVTIFGVGLSLLTSVVIGRLLGPDGRGALAAVTVWPAIIASIMCFSINDATTVMLAGAESDRSPTSTKEIIGTSFVLHLGIGLLSAAVCALAVPLLLGERRASTVGTAMIYGASFSVLTMIAMFQRGVLVGQHRTQGLNVLRIAQPIFWLGSLTILGAASALTWKTAAFASIAALAASVCLGLSILKPTLPQFSPHRAVELIKKGSRFQSANAALYAAAEADKVLILATLGDTDVGIYLVAQNISGLTAGVVSQTLAVRMLGDIAATETSTRGERVRIYFIASLLVAVMLGFGVLVCAPLIPMIYGKSFYSSVAIAQVLAIGFTLKAARAPVDQGLRASGFFVPGIVTELSALLVLICGTIILAPNITIETFSWIFSTAQFFALFAVCFIAARKYQMSLPYFLGISDGQLLKIVRSTIGGVTMALKR